MTEVKCLLPDGSEAVLLSGCRSPLKAARIVERKYGVPVVAVRANGEPDWHPYERRDP